MSTIRWSRAGLEQLRTELEPRDWQIIDMLGRQRLATGNQLERVHWPEASAADRRAARRALARLTNWRVLARLERRLGGLGRGSDSWTYALDVAGQRLRQGGTARRPRLPRPAMWAHALTSSEVHVRTVESLRGTDLTIGEWQGEPDCWRRYTGPLGEPVVIKPDGFMRLDGPVYSDLYFLEADTGSQSKTVIRAKLAAYRQYAASGVEQAREGVFPRVAFLTTTAARHGELIELLGEQPPETWALFAAGLVEDAGRLLTGQLETRP